MNERLGALAWYVPCGTVAGFALRISLLYPLVGLILGVRLGWSIGLAVTALLLLSTLVHELAHAAVCRRTGGDADAILIWPLGGLAVLEMPESFRSRLWTIAAGPLSNYLLCVLTNPAWYAPEFLGRSLVPFTLPIAEFQEGTLIRDWLLLTFAVNYLLVLVNLLPALPMDGGQIVETLLQRRFVDDGAWRLATLLSVLVGGIVMIVGLAGDWTWVLAVGCVILLFNLLQPFRSEGSEGGDESFLGYDFSQGYTSLERQPEDAGPERPDSWYAQWQAQRDAERAARESDRRRELEEQLDQLLARIHEVGMEGLTAAEKRQLKKASDALRSKRQS